MEKNELYNSAYSKMQKLYELIFDDSGDLKPEFYLTDEEIEAFRSHSDNSENYKKQQLETLFGGIIYNKYTFKYEPIPIIKRLVELSHQIDSLSKRKYDHNNVYARQALNWDGNVLFSTTGHSPDDKYYSVKIGLYNLEGASEYDINLQQEYATSKISGKINIVREKRKVAFTNVQFHIQDFGVESHDIRQLSSKESAKECIDVLLIAEKELSQILNNLTMEANSYREEKNGFRKR